MPDIVIHQMFRQVDGILPCCGLHRYEVKQSDRIAVGLDVTPTCDGTKRYESADHSIGAAVRNALRKQHRQRRRGR